MTDSTPADLLRAAMDAQGVTDPVTRAGLAAICMGESNMLGHVETGYSHTPNSRIRQVFGSRVNLPDATLDAIKADDRKFFDLVYGGVWGLQNLGNHPGTDDGYNFRGRGFIQLTGRANYQRYATKIGHPEIMDAPDLANRLDLAADLAVAYILDRYHGGGFDAMMASVGNNTPDIAATKRKYYAQFTASGEFASQPTPAPTADSAGSARPTVPPTAVPPTIISAGQDSPGSPGPDLPTRADVLDTVNRLQTQLKALGLYPGAIDSQCGPDTSAAAMTVYRRA